MSSFQLQENLLIEFKGKTDIYFKNKVSVSKKQKNASDVQEGTGSRIGKDVRNQGSLLCLSRFCLTWSFCFILLFFCTLAFPLPHIQIHGTEGCSLVLSGHRTTYPIHLIYFPLPRKIVCKLENRVFGNIVVEPGREAASWERTSRTLDHLASSWHERDFFISQSTLLTETCKFQISSYTLEQNVLSSSLTPIRTLELSSVHPSIKPRNLLQKTVWHQPPAFLGWQCYLLQEDLDWNMIHTIC